MRLFATRTPWAPWPNLTTTPDLHLALSLDEEPDAVALLGSAQSGPRGRFGIVGVPQTIQTLVPKHGALRNAVASRPKQTLRIALIGYECGRPLIHLPPAAAPADQPHAVIADLAAYAVVDHQTRTIAWGGPDEAACAKLQRLLTAPLRATRPPHAIFEPGVTDTEHARRLECVLDAIAAGDIYQANLTRQLNARGSLDGPSALYTLARHNPVAYAAWLRLGNVEVVSSTMETLLLHDAASRTSTSYPIKGTCARCIAPSTLRSDPKEQAEHVMIVDLVRNDLGKLAEPGGVDVPVLMGIEPYRGIWHGVSTVRARLRSEHHAGDALEALFPGGSIIGAPKRRAMQILQDIEEAPRGFYTGSLGVIAPNGDAHFSILIRTLVHDNAGWHLGVGGGIVADSKAARELTEMNEKVAVFRELLAAQAA